MTQNNGNTTDEGWTMPIDPAKPGLNRRTVLAGAAWSVPVIATAIGVPLAAASTQTPTLAFVNGPYSSTACQPVGDIVLRRTTDGTTPHAGQVITLTPPTGFTWEDGTTTARTQTTDANGEVRFTGLEAGPEGGSGTVIATSDTLTTSAPVSVSGGLGDSVSVIYLDGTVHTTSLPNGLSVTEMHATTRADGNPALSVLASDGSYWTYVNNTWGQPTRPISEHIAGVSTANGAYLGSWSIGGEIFYYEAGGVVESATLPNGLTVSEMHEVLRPDGTVAINVLASDGTYWVLNNGTWGQPSRPVSEHIAGTVAASGAYLGSWSIGGQIFYGETDGVLKSTTLPNGLTVSEMHAVMRPDGTVAINVLASDGTYWVLNNGTWGQPARPISEHIAGTVVPGGTYRGAWSSAPTCS